MALVYLPTFTINQYKSPIHVPWYGNKIPTKPSTFWISCATSWSEPENVKLYFFGKAWLAVAHGTTRFFPHDFQTALGFWDCWALTTNKKGLNEIMWNYVKSCIYTKMSWTQLVKLLMMFLDLVKTASWLAWWLWIPCFLKNKFQPTNDWIDSTTMAPRTLIKNMPCRATGIGPGKEKSDWDSKSNFTCFGKILSWVCVFEAKFLHSREMDTGSTRKGNSSSKLRCLRDVLVVRRVTRQPNLKITGALRGFTTSTKLCYHIAPSCGWFPGHPTACPNIDSSLYYYCIVWHY